LKDLNVAYFGPLIPKIREMWDHWVKII